MGRKTPDIIKQAARDLRKSMTKSEKLLWSIVKSEKIGFKINRQLPIYVFTEDSGLDRYIIADFYCPAKKLIIEIDGNIHDRIEVHLLDTEKEKLLLQAGYCIVRIKNEDINSDINGVIGKIQKLLTAASFSSGRERIQDRVITISTLLAIQIYLKLTQHPLNCISKLFP